MSLRRFRMQKSLLLTLIGLGLGLGMAACSQAQQGAEPVKAGPNGKTALQQQVLLEGLDFPWSLAFMSERRALLAERSGALWLIESEPNSAVGQAQAWRKTSRVAGMPLVASSGQGGMFDVALHPQFSENGWVYLAYNATDASGAMGTELLRAKLVMDAVGQASLQQRKTLFVMQPKSRSGRHFGGRIAFDRAGYVYLSLGDRGDEARAQKMNDHAGSVIRLHDDGRLPQDNPWVGAAGVKAEKYTLGQRNIQGLALEPSTGMMWSHEHGPQGGDEINPVERGKNYGWPVISYGVNYGIGTKIGEGTHKAGMEQPWTVWVPSIAPSGMAFYQGALFPDWQGDMLVGALRGQMLVRLRKIGDKWGEQERLLENQVGRIRDVRVGPDGAVYVLTDSDEGQLIRLLPR